MSQERVTNGTATTAQGPTITVADLLRTAEKLGAMPKGKWMLVAPDGRVWADEEISAIARAAALEAFRAAPPFSSFTFGNQQEAAVVRESCGGRDAGQDRVLGTGSAAGHTTAEFSNLSTQAHAYGARKD